MLTFQESTERVCSAIEDDADGEIEGLSLPDGLADLEAEPEGLILGL